MSRADFLDDIKDGFSSVVKSVKDGASVSACDDSLTS